MSADAAILTGSHIYHIYSFNKSPSLHFFQVLPDKEGKDHR